MWRRGGRVNLLTINSPSRVTGPVCLSVISMHLFEVLMVKDAMFDFQIGGSGAK